MMKGSSFLKLFFFIFSAILFAKIASHVGSRKGTRNKVSGKTLGIQHINSVTILRLWTQEQELSILPLYFLRLPTAVVTVTQCPLERLPYPIL